MNTLYVVQCRGRMDDVVVFASPDMMTADRIVEAEFAALKAGDDEDKPNWGPLTRAAQDVYGIDTGAFCGYAVVTLVNGYPTNFRTVVTDDDL